MVTSEVITLAIVLNIGVVSIALLIRAGYRYYKRVTNPWYRFCLEVANDRKTELEELRKICDPLGWNIYSDIGPYQSVAIDTRATTYTFPSTKTALDWAKGNSLKSPQPTERC